MQRVLRPDHGRGVTLVASLAVPALVAAALAAPARPAARPAPTQCTSAWRIVPSADYGTGDNVLNAVAAVSPQEAYAVGYREYAHRDLSLAERFDGGGWRITKSANPGNRRDDVFLDVLALGPRRAWAVGQFLDRKDRFRPLVERLHRGQWVVAPHPRRPVRASLAAITGTSPGDLWAVGARGFVHPIIEHWNGSRWRKVAVPGSAADDLEDVVAISPDDAWAVGQTLRAHGVRELVLYWDGTEWSRVKGPSRRYGELRAVTAFGPNDVWAVGERGRGAGGGTLVEHFDGGSWQRVPSANPDTGGAELNGVAGAPSGLGFAVGDYVPSGGRDVWTPFIERWDGSSWRIVPSPTLPGQNSFLNGIAQSNGDWWAVGNHDGPKRARTLVEAGCADHSYRSG